MGPFSLQTIRQNRGYHDTPADNWTYIPVVIIGGGQSGIAMGCRLKEALGFDQFRIFERQGGVGGTWYINRYPGVACDVPALFYSFSFCPNAKWTTFFPSGPEILNYLQKVCEKYELLDKIVLNSEVKDCVWNEEEKIWNLTIQHLTFGSGDLTNSQMKQKISDEGPSSVYLREEKIRAKIVISGVGGLVEPQEWPSQIPGKEQFKGNIFHSARWRYDVDLNDKEVVVVGTGCSAAQFVPQLTAKYGARKVTQLMRSPPWVQPRAIPPGGDEKWQKYSPWLCSNIPLFQRLMRILIFVGSELSWPLFGSGTRSEKHRAKVEQMLLKHMKQTVPKQYHEMLTPDYGVGCKRRIFDVTWLQGLNDPKIDLVTRPLIDLQENSVTLGASKISGDSKSAKRDTVPADVIILANGFQISEWMHPIDVIGKEGKGLHSVFAERGGVQMYQGGAMDGFPNFFALFGPNTATGHSSVILATENMVEYSLKFIKPILDGDVETVDVKKDAEIAYTADIQRALKDTVWQSGGCSSWYKTEDGWNSTVYPYTQWWYTLRCLFPIWSDWNIEYTSQGLRRKRIRSLSKYAVIATLMVAAARARSAGISLLDVPRLAKGYARVGTFVAAGFLQSLGSKI